MAIVDAAYKDGYEHEYERELLGRDGADVGVTVWIKGLDCEASLAVHDGYQRNVTDLRIRAAGEDLPEGKVGDLVVDEMRDRYLACISRWEFNGAELFDSEGVPVCDDETKRRFFNIPLFGKQVREWIAEIGDFTPA